MHISKITIGLYLRNISIRTSGCYTELLPANAILVRRVPCRSDLLQYYMHCGSLYKVVVYNNTSLGTHTIRIYSAKLALDN